MNRRAFMKKIAVAAAAYVSIRGGVELLKDNPKPPRRPLTEEEKRAIIAEALKTPEGREALAKAMIEPIRREMEYQGVGRKYLFQQ